MKQPMPETSNESPWSAPAAEVLQSHCRQIEAYAPLDSGAGEQPDARQASPLRAALSRDDLPDVLRALVERYEAAHPGTRLVPIRYVSTGSSDSMATTGDTLEGDLVSLSVTESVVDAERIQVWSRVVIARRG